MEKIIYACNTCGKVTHDLYKEKWIIIDGSFQENSGRDKQGKGRTKIFLSMATKSHHFCTWECLKNVKT